MKCSLKPLRFSGLSCPDICHRGRVHAGVACQDGADGTTEISNGSLPFQTEQKEQEYYSDEYYQNGVFPLEEYHCAFMDLCSQILHFLITRILFPECRIHQIGDDKTTNS